MRHPKPINLVLTPRKYWPYDHFYGKRDQRVFCFFFRIKKEWWDHIPSPAHSSLVAVVIQEPQVGAWAGPDAVDAPIGSWDSGVWDVKDTHWLLDLHLSRQEGLSTGRFCSPVWSSGTQRLPPPLGFQSHLFSLGWVPSLGRRWPLRSSACHLLGRCLCQGRRPRGQAEGDAAPVCSSYEQETAAKAPANLPLSHWSEWHHVLFLNLHLQGVGMPWASRVASPE